MQEIKINWSKLTPLKQVDIEKINVAGVYRISKKATDDGNYYVFFVGSAENIKEKLLEHISINEKNTRLQKYLTREDSDIVFRYAVVENESMRQAVEKQMYEHYLPEYNLEEPKSSFDIDANLN